jgi:type I restriction enzyme S subunit
MAERILKSFEVWIAAQGVKSRTRLRSVDNISLEGINHLRLLILELAVKGKLVVQNHREENARNLMERVGIEKQRLFELGRIKKIKKTIEIKKEDIPFSIPESWYWVRLSDYYDVRDGTHDSPKAQHTGFPLVTSKNLVDGKLDLANVNFISQQDHLKIQERSRVDNGDVLFAMIGSIGNPVIVDTDIEFSIKNVALFKYYNRELCSPGYLKLFLDVASIEMKKNASGGVQSFVSLGNLRSYPMPLPPLAEQHRIVAKVEELMALCYELEKQETHHLHSHALLVETLLGTLTQAKDAKEFQQAWSSLAQHFDDLFTTEDSIDQLKLTILQLAVMGKLVPQDPNDEPASVLLEWMRKEKERLVEEEMIKNQKPLPSIKDSEKPFEIPKGWQWERWGNLANWITYGFTRPMSHVNEGIPIVTGKNVLNGAIDFTTADYTTIEEFNGLNEKDKPKKGDILVTKDGTIGRAAIVDTDDLFCINQSVAILWLKDKPLDKKFLLHVILSPSVQSEFLAKAAGVAIKHISVTHFGMMLCQIPPLKEQQRIVSKVNELFALCDGLKARLAAAQTLANQMAKAVVEQV